MKDKIIKILREQCDKTGDYLAEYNGNISFDGVLPMDELMSLFSTELREELFAIPYLCEYCVSRQNEETGACDCECHEADVIKHLEGYEKQLMARLDRIGK